MRFWLPYRVEPMGKPAYAEDDPARIAMLISEGIPVKRARLKMSALKLVINGEYETSNPTEVKLLMEAGGSLRFNPLDAINEGIFTAAEVLAMGFAVPVEPEVKPEPPKVEEPKPVLPDFNTMSKEKLVEWADAQEPPIHLDRRKRKDALVKEVKAELKER